MPSCRRRLWETPWPKTTGAAANQERQNQWDNSKAAPLTAASLGTGLGPTSAPLGLGEAR